MPVQSAQAVLDTFMRVFLAARVPDDQMATYIIAPVVVEEVVDCEEHGEQLSQVAVWQFSVLLQPVDEDAPINSVRMSGQLPFEYLDDGDTEPLKEIMEKLWQEHTFSTMMREVDPELEKAALEEEG